MKQLPKAFKPRHVRWFVFMNVAIALLLLSSSAILNKCVSRYDNQANVDAGFLFRSKGETNAKTLQGGLFYTEHARAAASRSLLHFSNGASLTGLIIAFAFCANAFYIFRMNRNHNRLMAEAMVIPTKESI